MRCKNDHDRGKRFIGRRRLFLLLAKIRERLARFLPTLHTMMDFLFGRHRKTSQELLRENRRALSKAIRELDRERNRLVAQERAHVAEIKKSARNGQIASRDAQRDATRNATFAARLQIALKATARTLVKTRAQIVRLVTMRANFEAIGFQIHGLKSQSVMMQVRRRKRATRRATPLLIFRLCEAQLRL